ncbi:P-loop containing nucleoside triphosphate hydrolase protein, partial [Baffinella frigidus]
QVDGLNIAAVPLGILRKSLAIIPQDPVLFSGTLRYNLDPFNEATNDQLNQILECLKSYHAITGGENLSMGQRQLVALARVLIRQPKILMLDEATASVDLETDAVIQKTINERILAGGRSTLLVIAHRLTTVVDSHKVLVMDKGTVGEFKSPKELLSNRSAPTKITTQITKLLHKSLNYCTNYTITVWQFSNYYTINVWQFSLAGSTSLPLRPVRPSPPCPTLLLTEAVRYLCVQHTRRTRLPYPTPKLLHDWHLSRVQQTITSAVRPSINRVTS